MMQLSERMQALLERRKKNKAYRSAQNNASLIDFCSNDYLSLARSAALQEKVHQKARQLSLGATGSRLLSGHYELLETLEQKVAQFHQGEAALVFNSGYNANLSLLACLPRRADVILYDELVHASIHDGLKLSAAASYAFAHNDVLALERLLEQHKTQSVFVVVEAIYSMDGDAALLEAIHQKCQAYQAYLIVDEAHSTGTFGRKGEGLCVDLGIDNQVFARVHTFGKAIGVHGAAVVGSTLLKDYLFNFARPLIYTTNLPPHTALTVLEAYCHLEEQGEAYLKELQERIAYFRELIFSFAKGNYIESNSPIQSILVPGNEQVVQLARQLQAAGYDARPIRFPTVAMGKERIRICLHRHNSMEEIKRFVDTFIHHLN